MNFRERFLNTLLFRHVDSIPCMDYGYWPETIQKWHDEGLPADVRSVSQVEDYLGLDRGYLPWHKSFDLESNVDNLSENNEIIYVEANWFSYWGDICPPFQEETLDEDEDTVVLKTEVGTTIRKYKGMQSMPQFLEFPVKNMGDWEIIKKRLDGKDPNRYPRDWGEKLVGYKSTNNPLGLYIMGFFGMVRDLMGLENLSLAYYDQPELITAIAIHHTQFIKDTYSRALADLQIDFVITFEDMCYTSGSLISPKFFRKYLFPYYAQITEFFKNKGVKLVLVDTDGNVLNIMQQFLDAGVDGCIPCEVKAGSNPVSLRKLYPSIRLLGGVDKMAVNDGPAAIDRELEKLIPVIEQGGYIPGIDHLVPPNIKFEHYRYFCDRRRDLVDKYHQ